MQNQFKDKMNLNVDKVKQGSGTTNTGNVARAFFSNPEMASDITGIDCQLIKNISYMLQAINSKYPIDIPAYREFGQNTARLYVQLYEWYYMPQSLHRLFFHVHQVAEILPVTIGESSEEAIETSHKCIMQAINHHSRQHSYKAINNDVGHYRLLQTDPVLNDISKKHKGAKKKTSKPLHEGTRNLLKSHLPASSINENTEHPDTSSLDIEGTEHDNILTMPDIN